MNDFETFEDILIDNDFSVQEKPIFNIPEDVDVQTQFHLRTKAHLEMAEANAAIARSVASEKYELLEQLTELYLKASSADRRRIRKFLKDIERWRNVFRYWNPNSKLITEDAERFLRLFLANLSMLAGGDDRRDTIIDLATTWHMVEEVGLDAEPLYREALYWGDELAEGITNVLDPTRRRANCIKCQTGQPHLEVK